MAHTIRVESGRRVNISPVPSHTGFNTPSRIEADIADLAHEGTIPLELNGAFHRVQPDPQFPPRLGDDISFNGDGMITRFHIHDGRCDFRQRWAQTDKWKLENAAEQHFWAGPVSTLQEPCFVPRSKDAPEGDGWIVQLCNRMAEHRSDLLVFDPLEIEKGPISTIAIPIRLRFGLHGNWANSDEIGLAA